MDSDNTFLKCQNPLCMPAGGSWEFTLTSILLHIGTLSQTELYVYIHTDLTIDCRLIGHGYLLNKTFHFRVKSDLLPVCHSGFRHTEWHWYCYGGYLTVNLRILIQSGEQTYPCNCQSTQCNTLNMNAKLNYCVYVQCLYMGYKPSMTCM